MRIGAIVFIATLLLTGCAHLDISRKARAVSQIEPGELQADVFSKLGPPDLRHDITEKRFVAFYQTKPTISSTSLGAWAITGEAPIASNALAV